MKLKAALLIGLLSLFVTGCVVVPHHHRGHGNGHGGHAHHDHHHHGGHYKHHGDRYRGSHR